MSLARIVLGATGGAVLLTAATAGAVEMRLQFYQCPAATAQGASCGARGIEEATVCVEVLDGTLHPDVDFGTVVAVEELRTRTSTGTPGVRPPGVAALDVFPFRADSYPFFVGTLRFIMIPPRHVDACRAACDVQYEWDDQPMLPRPISDVHACNLDVVKRDDYRCTEAHEAPYSQTGGGTPAGRYRRDENGEVAMVEDGHPTWLFGMALACPESRLREQVRPGSVERLRPGSLQDQMRPTLPQPGDLDPRGMRGQPSTPTR